MSTITSTLFSSTFGITPFIYDKYIYYKNATANDATINRINIATGAITLNYFTIPGGPVICAMAFDGTYFYYSQTSQYGFSAGICRLSLTDALANRAGTKIISTQYGSDNLFIIIGFYLYYNMGSYVGIGRLDLRNFSASTTFFSANCGLSLYTDGTYLYTNSFINSNFAQYKINLETGAYSTIVLDPTNDFSQYGTLSSSSRATLYDNILYVKTASPSTYILAFDFKTLKLLPTVYQNTIASINSVMVGPSLADISKYALYISSSTGVLRYVTLISDPAACYNEGTKILCFDENSQQEHYAPIETLRPGNLVKTYLHGYKKIEMIGKNTMMNNPYKYDECMYKMIKNDSNELIEDLIITGQHAILVDQLGQHQEEMDKFRLKRIDNKCLLFSSVSKDFVKMEDRNMYTYYHLCLDNGDGESKRFGIWANGILSETTFNDELFKDKYILLEN